MIGKEHDVLVYNAMNSCYLTCLPVNDQSNIDSILAEPKQTDLLDRAVAGAAVAAILAKLNILFHCPFLLQSRKKYVLEVDTISVHKGQSFFIGAIEPFPSPQTPCDHFKHDLRPSGCSFSPRLRTSICLRSLSTPGGITAFDPDHPGILVASIDSAVHSHFRWRRHVSVTGRQSLAACRVRLSIVWVS
jgi:hypothetical protein